MCVFVLLLILFFVRLLFGYFVVLWRFSLSFQQSHVKWDEMSGFCVKRLHILIWIGIKNIQNRNKFCYFTTTKKKKHTERRIEANVLKCVWYLPQLKNPETCEMAFEGEKKRTRTRFNEKKKVELEWRNEQNKDQHISCTVIHACRIMKKKHWNGHGRRWKNWLKFILMLLLLLAFFCFFRFSISRLNPPVLMFFIFV